jgi:hypothetical protein
MQKPLRSFLYKTCLFVVPIFVLFEILFRLSINPHFSRSGFFDAKMMTMQKRHIKQIDIMMTGSSVAAYDIVDSAIVGSFNKSYYNLSSWSLQVTDMAALDSAWVINYHPKYLVLCSVLSDFSRPDQKYYTNYVNTNNWIKNNFLEYFYFRDYRSISQLLRRQFGTSFSFNEFGGQPSPFTHEVKEWHKWKDKEDSFPTVYTPANYNALNSLAAFLKQQRVKFIFIQTPIGNSRSGEAFYKKMVAKHFAICKSIVERHNGIYLNYYNRAQFPDSLFNDKNHLLVKGAALLTTKVVKDLKSIIK